MEKLAQIVSLRPNGRDPRTVVPMESLAKQVEALAKMKDWPGKALRPVLELRDDSGAKLDPKTGEAIGKPVPKPAPEPES